jgi:hypothetical protein
MSITVGVFDLFAYTVPGSLYLTGLRPSPTSGAGGGCGGLVRLRSRVTRAACCP